mmetsp:Transcript_52378/g.112022  ORF Transcript_52378/g.112022 Transcript_52378/m.112022 type:complete len:207 (+) Transcript_52378:304-924(+)
MASVCASMATAETTARKNSSVRVPALEPAAASKASASAMLGASVQIVRASAKTGRSSAPGSVARWPPTATATANCIAADVLRAVAAWRATFQWRAREIVPTMASALRTTTRAAVPRASQGTIAPSAPHARTIARSTACARMISTASAILASVVTPATCSSFAWVIAVGTVAAMMGYAAVTKASVEMTAHSSCSRVGLRASQKDCTL